MSEQHSNLRRVIPAGVVVASALEIASLAGVASGVISTHAVPAWMLMIRALQTLVAMVILWSCRKVVLRVVCLGLVVVLLANVTVRVLFLVGDHWYESGQDSLAEGGIVDAENCFKIHQAAYNSAGLQIDSELRLTARGLVRDREGEIALALGEAWLKRNDCDQALRYFNRALVHARVFDPTAVGEIESLIEEVEDSEEGPD